jgi:hypothetical protein
VLLSAFIGDSGASGGKSACVEPFGWLDSGSTGAGAGSGEFDGGGVGASAVGSLGLFWSSMRIVYHGKREAAWPLVDMTFERRHENVLVTTHHISKFR